MKSMKYVLYDPNIYVFHELRAYSFVLQTMFCKITSRLDVYRKESRRIDQYPKCCENNHRSNFVSTYSLKE